MGGHGDEGILHEQKQYYRARAGEYDEWFQRLGRYDKGQDNKKRWFSQTEEVRKALDEFTPAGRVLELACGTGSWTGQLAHHADSVLAVDSSPEVLEINRQKTNAENVSYIEADLFEWRPGEKFDVVAFGFWLTHVPPEKFEWFWDLLRDCLNPGGRVFLVDSLYTPESTAENNKLGAEDEIVRTRELNDGRTFRIVKVFYDAKSLTEKLAAVGWQADMRQTQDFFLYGSACPAASQRE